MDMISTVSHSNVPNKEILKSNGCLLPSEKLAWISSNSLTSRSTIGHSGNQVLQVYICRCLKLCYDCCYDVLSLSVNDHCTVCFLHYHCSFGFYTVVAVLLISLLPSFLSLLFLCFFAISFSAIISIIVIH